MTGMFAFKLIIVAVVLLIANIVAIRRFGTARNLLYFGSFAIGTVVAYSVFLMMKFNGLRVEIIRNSKRYCFKS